MDSPFRPSEPVQPADLPRNVRPVQGDTPYVPAPPAPAFSLTLGDIYYVLFRHKWKILLCSAAGLLAAVALFKTQKPPYQSEAKLFIRYVTESKALTPPSDDTLRKSPDQRGETIINSELQILTSLDLAKQVAATIGPDKIVGNAAGGQDPVLRLDRAAFLISHNLTVDVPLNSSVINVVFEHQNPAIVQPVLRELIDRYEKMHVEIHRSAGILGDSLTQETDQLRARLAQTEDELRKAINKAGVISVDDAKKAFTDQMARIQQDIFSAQAELAERAAVLQKFSRNSPTGAPVADNSPDPTPDQLNQYRALSSRQDALQKREQDLLVYFKEENIRVQQVRQQLAEVGGELKKLEDVCPKVTRIVLVPEPASAQSAPNVLPTGPVDLNAEAARLDALQAKIKVLNSQLDEVRGEASKVEQMEGTISELQRKKDLEEANYRYYSASLEQSRIDETLGTGSVSNIGEIQTPSPPTRDWSKTVKLIGGAAFGGIAIGLAWAFLIELFFDRSIKRPKDVERMAKLPLFLSIPLLGRSERRRLTAAATDRLSLPAPAGAASGAGTNGAAAAVPAALPVIMDHVQLLHPFHETLRDRLIAYFESQGLTHKPKLVAVTGLGRESGVTTTAAGLAGTLSETGDGNVLLVDMTIEQGSAQQFYKGKAVCGLEEVLDSRGPAQIQDNLFVVGEGPGGNKLSRILPQRFNKLVPKLKASDFDYIIFDMPPVSQLSITPRLAGFMDMVLLVIESEKTDQDLVQRASAMLAASKAHVGAVLNKTKTYVPPILHQDSLGNL